MIEKLLSVSQEGLYSIEQSMGTGSFLLHTKLLITSNET
jgi:hypothetical protein